MEKAQQEQNLRVAMIWNGTIIQEKVLQKAADIMIGEGIKNTFVIPAESLPNVESFPLFTSSQAGYTINLTESMSGKVTIGDTTQPVSDFIKSRTKQADGSYACNVGKEDWGVITIQNLTFFWQFISQTDKIPKRAIVDFDWYLAKLILLAFIIHAAFIVGSYLLWDEKPGEIPAVPDRFAKFIVEKAPEPPPEEELEKGPDEGVGKRHMGKEGKAGEQDKPVHVKTKIPKATQRTIQKVSRMGALGALATNKFGGPLKEIFSSETSGFGDRLGAAMDGTGDQFVMGHGTGGWSTKGTGTGGGGTGWGRVYGTSSIDTGGGRGVRARMGRRKERKVKYRVKRGTPEVDGFLSKEQINRVVKAHAGGIRFCYEKELRRFPKLSGKIVMNWTIALNGRVKRAFVQHSTMKNSRVENCLRRNIKRWIFPKPQGGRVVVSYPFLFRGGL